MIVILDKQPELYEQGILEYNKYFKTSPEQEKEYSERILAELREEFARLGITPGYPLSGIGLSDASGWTGGLCLHHEDGYWLVYHSERGNRSRPEIFTSVQSASNYFLWVHLARPDGTNTDIGMLPRIKTQGSSIK